MSKNASALKVKLSFWLETTKGVLYGRKEVGNI